MGRTDGASSCACTHRGDNGPSFLLSPDQGKAGLRAPHEHIPEHIECLIVLRVSTLGYAAHRCFNVAHFPVVKKVDAVRMIGLARQFYSPEYC